jgi:hypothetical protein
VSRVALVHGSAVVAVVAVLLAGAASLQHAREQWYPAAVISEETLYVTSGKTVQKLTAGYNALAADLYWIRAIQYYGGIRRRLADERAARGNGSNAPTDYHLLYPLLDLATTLDPYFNIAYRFGSIFLADPFPGGAGRPDLAVALLQKGLRARPDKWEYMQDIGFVHYWWHHDYQTAAAWFVRAGSVPGAPWFLKSLAATTLAQGGDRESSRTMWQSILKSAENDWLREDAERRLLQLRALDEIDELQKRADRVTADSGRPPSDWTAVLRARVVPLDPMKTPYGLEEGRVRLSRTSPLFPLPVEPQPAPPSSR